MIPVENSHSMLFRFILHRLNKGRDAQILIVARGGARGTGKTTLAVAIAQWIHSLLRCPDCSYQNEHGDTVGGLYPPSFDGCPWCGNSESALTRPEWEADQAFISVDRYLSYYKHNSSPGDALILDEAEFGADKRRAMSSSNVELSQAWSVLRYKSCVSIATMPSTMQIDNRLEQLADVEIIVQRRGMGHLKWYWLNDKEKKVWNIPMRNEWGDREYIFWDALHDEEYRKVARMKGHHVDGQDDELIPKDQAKEMAEKRAEKKLEPLRIKSTKALLEHSDLNQTEIGDQVDRSQQWVSKVARGEI